MFTGIVEEKGKIAGLQKGAATTVLTISGKIVFDDLKIGDSVAVNGICLTVNELGDHVFKADIMPETVKRSCFSELKPGHSVNLERAMAVNGRLGGHMMSGHIDGVGKIAGMKKDKNAVRIEIETEPKILYYIVEKGSIAIDGISLTVAEVTEKSFCVSVIPHTLETTVLSEKEEGDIVNLENDMIGKYIERFCLSGKDKPLCQNLTLEKLADFGF